MKEIHYDTADKSYCQLKEHHDGAVGVLTPDGEDEHIVFEADEFYRSEFYQVPQQAVDDPVGYLEEFLADVTDCKFWGKSSIPVIKEVGIEWAIKQTEITESDE